MALLDKLFGNSNPTVEAVDQKLADLEISRSRIRQERALLEQRIAELKGQVQETTAEAMMSNSAEITKRRRGLRNEIAELRRRNDEADEELDAMDTLEAALNAERAAAANRLKLAEWDRKAAELVTLSKDIDQLIVGLGSKLVKAAPLVSDLSGMTPTSANYRPTSVWHDSVRVWMARHCDGAQIPGVLSRNDVNSQISAGVTEFTDCIETNLKRLRGSLCDSPTRG